MSHHVSERAVGYALKQQRMTAAEFLAWDKTQTIKHEFVQGEVFAMAGGEDRNDIAAGNLYIALRQHLRGTSCRVYGSDVKLRVDEADCYFYPDLMVTCSQTDSGDRLVKREPVLVVEVLSSGTAAYDRGDKFACYRMLPQLREYLLVDIAARRCDLFRKQAPDGLWVLHPTDEKQALHLASVDLTMAPEALWADLDPRAPADDQSPAV